MSNKFGGVDLNKNKLKWITVIEKIKILRAVLELPAKEHCQFSPFGPFLRFYMLLAPPNFGPSAVPAIRTDILRPALKSFVLVWVTKQLTFSNPGGHAVMCSDAGTGGPGGPLARPILSRSVNPIPTGGGQIIPTYIYYYWHPQNLSPSGRHHWWLRWCRGVNSFLNPGWGAGSSMRGIIGPPGLNRVNWTPKPTRQLHLWFMTFCTNSWHSWSIYVILLWTYF